MSYMDLLDKNKSIQAARHEMEHFSDLYKLHEFKDNYEIGSGTGNDSIISIINCLVLRQEKVPVKLKYFI